MSDYKELIEKLKISCSFLDYDCCELTSDAADALEELVTKCHRLEEERDAAVDDLKEYCDCDACVGTHDMCDTCLFKSNWKWRGVQDE